MSDPTPQDRKLVNKDVIVYNMIAKSLTVEKAEKHKAHIEDPEKTLKISPKHGNSVELTQNGLLIARLDLHLLGPVANMKRALGKCNQIVIIS